MGWKRLYSDKKQDGKELLLYSLAKDSDGYQIQVSDLKSVWVETLDDETIRKRSETLKSIIALDTRSDIDELMGLIEENMDRPAAIDLGGNIVLNYTISLGGDGNITWYFDCKLQSVADSQASIYSFILGVLEATSNLNDSFAQAKKENRELIYHIKNLARICAKEQPYKPHRYQNIYNQVVGTQDSLLLPDTFYPGHSENIPSSPLYYEDDDMPAPTSKWEKGFDISSHYWPNGGSHQSSLTEAIGSAQGDDTVIVEGVNLPTSSPATPLQYDAKQVQKRKETEMASSEMKRKRL